MDIALCYESVLPARGGCEHYISDLARRLARDGHAVHLYASRWDVNALPPTMHYHRLPVAGGPRFLRPWRFAKSVEVALKQRRHDVTMGFDKTWGQDILYPQGGLHVASAAHNILKHPPGIGRMFARWLKLFDPAARSFRQLERKLYLSAKRPIILVNSKMVQRHFETYYDIPPSDVHVLPAAIDPDRFVVDDRFKRREEERQRWGVADDEPVGLFVAMNYRLKGLAPLLHSLRHVDKSTRYRIAVVGNPRFESYEGMAKRLGVADRVKFLGFRADPKDAYFAADFLVHPTFYDPCSLVVLEALACGLPVVTSQYNGASELFTDGKEGFSIADPHDHRALGNAITKLLDGPTRSQCASAARQTAKLWTFEQHYQQLLGYFQKAASLRKAA
jgi:UDP-glucose:(heptosyl)LPS alpha-1,3-glucosyltransferase